MKTIGKMEGIEILGVEKCKPGYESCVTAERDMNRRVKDGVKRL